MRKSCLCDEKILTAHGHHFFDLQTGQSQRSVQFISATLCSLLRLQASQHILAYLTFIFWAVFDFLETVRKSYCRCDLGAIAQQHIKIRWIRMNYSVLTALYSRFVRSLAIWIYCMTIFSTRINDTTMRLQWTLPAWAFTAVIPDIFRIQMRSEKSPFYRIYKGI